MARKSNNADSKWVGQRFGDLVVLRFEYSESQGRYVWVCKCDCGQVVSVVPANARAGRVRSCGCAQLKSATTHGMRNTRLYRIWVDMRRRCRDTSRKAYKHYGARGITVCEEWDKSFEGFMQWAYREGYSDELSIDRIDVDGNYDPSNCRWATAKQQARNRRSTRYLDAFGETLPAVEAVEKYGNGIKIDTVLKRIDLHGYSVEEALTRPVCRGATARIEIGKRLW